MGIAKKIIHKSPKLTASKTIEESMETKDILRLIKQERERQGMSQKEMAEALDISPGYYSKLESNHRQIDLNMVVKIAKVLGKTLPELLGSEAKSEEKRQEDLGKISQMLNKVQKEINKRKGWYSKLLTDS